MSKTRKIVIIAVSVIAVVAVAATVAYFLLRPPSSQTTKIDLHMYGVALTEEGETYKGVEFDITGEKVNHSGEEDSDLDLSISFPTGYEPFTHAKTEGHMIPIKLPDYYISSFLAYIPEKNDTKIFDIGLSTELKYCIIECVSGGENYKYIVGSVSQDFDTEEIMEFFKDIVEK